MPDDKFSSDRNAETVDVWEAHPKHKRGRPYWPIGTPDRRRSDNAILRRWMTLGDQALNSQQQTEEPDEDKNLNSAA